MVYLYTGLVVYAGKPKYKYCTYYYFWWVPKLYTIVENGGFGEGLTRHLLCKAPSSYISF